MKLFISLFFVTLLTFSSSWGQNNLGFEDGTIGGWVGSFGEMSPANDKTNFLNERSGNRDLIVTSLSDGNDPKINIEAISMVAPGSTHSVRLGYIVQGNRFERIKTSFVVSADKALFIYKFAVLLHSDEFSTRANKHQVFQKPGFKINIYAEDSTALPCSNFDVQILGDNQINGFKKQGDILYKNWTNGAIDLQKYIGKKIIVEVTAHGCTQSGHFGYAYFDAETIKPEITEFSKCPGDDGLLILQAPSGFEKYAWSNGVTTQNDHVLPNVGDKYSVDLYPYNTIADNCKVKMDYTIKYYKAGTNNMSKTICEYDSVIVEKIAYRTSGNYTININRRGVCDSTVILKLIVKPFYNKTFQKNICLGQNIKVGNSTYSKTGSYTNVFKTAELCDSVINTKITVDNDFKIENLKKEIIITEGDSVLISPIINPNGNYLYKWQSIDNSICTSCNKNWVKPMQYTIYNINANLLGKTCGQNQNVTVIVDKCGIRVPDLFTPNGDGINEIFYILGNGCIANIDLFTIYNRWGEIVFEDKNFKPSDINHGWDGRYLGIPIEPDLFPFVVTAKLENGTKKTVKGKILLVR